MADGNTARPTRQELADQLTEWLGHLHAEVAELPEGSLKALYVRDADLLHRVAERIGRRAEGGGFVILSGGEPK